jgi:hypothetical protein
MHAIIKDTHGQELARFDLTDDEPLDCHHYARLFESMTGGTLIFSDGGIPDGCEDISVTLTEDPDSVRCWDSENYFIEYQ